MVSSLAAKHSFTRHLRYLISATVLMIALRLDHLAKGKEVLYDHAINGFKGMPAKRSDSDLSDEEVKNVVDYMAEKSK